MVQSQMAAYLAHSNGSNSKFALRCTSALQAALKCIKPRALGQGCCFNVVAIAIASARRAGGEAWRRKRHGAPNCEPPEKIRPDQTPQSLRPMRRDVVFAGMVGVSGPASDPASVGMRRVRLQVRDARLVS